MWKNIITQGALQIVILGAILFKGTFLLIKGLRSLGSSHQSGLNSGQTNPASTTAFSSTLLYYSKFSTK
jgi:hypothetical protein